MSAGQRSARARAISEGKADEEDVKGPDSQQRGATEIEHQIADASDKDVSEVSVDERQDVIKEVVRERTSESSGSDSPPDKPMNSPDVDTNDPENPEESRSGADVAGDGVSVLKKLLDQTTSKSQDASKTEDTSTDPYPYSDTVADAVDGGSEESSGSEGGLGSVLDGGSVQVVLLAIVALGGAYLVLKRGDS